MPEKVCFHCGLTTNAPIIKDNKDFCCSGCVAVYEILKKGKLYKYYDIENAPGIRNDQETQQVYEYLEQEDIKKSVLDFYDGRYAKIRLYIPAIHCSSCIWLLENLEKLNSGVIRSEVNFNKKQVSVSFDESKITLSSLMVLLQSIHYKPHLLDKKQSGSKQSKKQLIIKLGLAGFAFGNVMLLSFPEYLSDDINLNHSLVNTFGWISLLLSLPVVVYSASDYFLTSWKNLKNKVISIDLPIVLGILTILFRSVFEIASAAGPGYLDSLTGLVFFLLIGKWYQSISYQALNFENDYTNYFPLGITKISGNKNEIVPIQQLQQGDVIQVKNTEILPADSELNSKSALVDYSFITGESIPITLSKGEKVFAGGKVLGVSAEFNVLKKVESGYLAQLWNERSVKGHAGQFISSALNQVSKYFTLAILTLALGAALYWLLVDPTKALFAFTSVLIVACPCALALSVPFALGHGRRVLGQNGFYLKEPGVIENLNKGKAIVFDKTGTLTNTNSYAVDFVANNEAVVDERAFYALFNQSNHPLSRAIAKYLNKNTLLAVEYFKEVAGKGLEGKVGGQTIRAGSHLYILGVEAPKTDRAEVHLEIDGSYLGYYSIRNHYRPRWKNLLRKLQKHFEVHLLSGDNEAERETILEMIKDPKRVNFMQTPVDKLNYIEALKKQKQGVIMVGDGLNDAGAFNASDVGISVADDVYQFTPSCDAIINASALVKLPGLIRFSKTVMRIVYLSFVLSFAYNVVGISYAVSGNLSPIVAAILMPLSSITIVAFTSLSTMYMSRYLKK